MNLRIEKVDLGKISVLRKLFLQENNFQIRYNAVHERGWSDSYLLIVNDLAIGYVAVKGKEEILDRDAVFEFYLIPSYRRWTSKIFAQALAIIRPTFIVCQTNEPILTALLYEFSQNINAEAVLFNDSQNTDYQLFDYNFRLKNELDNIFTHQAEPEGNYVLEKAGEVVATGGFFTHYNFPFADLYMEVKENYRKMGLGTYLIQELKKQCYLSGRVPVARCNVDNQASKATLLRAGMAVCGFVLVGNVNRN